MNPSTVDIEILEGETPYSLSDEEASKSPIQVNDNKILIQTSDSGRFLIEDENKIVVTAQSHATASDISTILTEVVINIALYKKKRWLLHASAVEINGKAILFCGKTGTGKSIIAAALSQKGARLISDDCTCIEIDGDTAYAHIGSTNYCLWPDSIKALNKSPKNHPKLRPSIEKRSVEKQSKCINKTAIGTVFLVNRGQIKENTQESIEAIPPHEILAKLEMETCFRTWFNNQDPKFPFFQEAIQLVRKSKCYSLNRLRHNPNLENTTKLIMHVLNEGKSDA